MIPLHLVFRRLLHRWSRLLIVALGVLLATALLASAPLLVDTVIRLGLQETLQSSDPLTANLKLTVHCIPDPAVVQGLDEHVRRVLGDTLTGLDPQAIASVESAGLFPWMGDGMLTDERVTFRRYEGLDARSVLVAGSWPSSGQRSSASPADAGDTRAFTAVIPQSMADAYDLEVGAEIPLARQRSDADPVAALTVSGILEPDAWRDPYWFGIYGPLQPYHDGRWVAEHNVFVTDADFYDSVARLLPRANLTLSWHVLLDTQAIAKSDPAATRLTLEALRQDLAQGEPRIATVTDLDNVLATYERQATIIRAPLTLLTAEIVVLALYYVLMVAALVTRQTETEFAILGSRGASRRQVFVMQAAEALSLGAIALASGPGLGIVLVRSLGWWGPLADLTIGAWTLTPTRAAWVAAGAGGGASVLGMLLPIGPALQRSIVAQQQSRTREPRSPWWQRLYLDVFALAAGIVLLGRLHLYGTIVGGSATRPEVDWLLLLSPLALLLGSATILLRLFPLILRLLAGLAAAGRGLPAALALWPSSRDPSHVARLVLLLTLAMALGVLATGLNATLDLSESERAAYATGGDLKVAVRDIVATDPLRTDPKVRTVAPVWRAMGTVMMQSPYPRFEMLAVDPEAMQTITTYRDDFADDPMPELLGALHRTEAPALADLSTTVVLPGRPTDLGVWVWAPPDSAAGLPSSTQAVVLGTSNHDRVQIRAKVRTAEGNYLVIPLLPARSDACESRCWDRFPCAPERPWAGLSHIDCRWVYFSGALPDLGPAAYPLSLASFWFRNQTTIDSRQGRRALQEVAISLAIDEITVTGRATATGPSATRVVEGFETPERIWVTSAGSSRYRATGGHTGPARQDLVLTFGGGVSTIGFAPYTTGIFQPIPVLLSPAFAETTGLAVGDTFRAWLASLPDLTFRVAGRLTYFPTMYENQSSDVGSPNAGFIVAPAEDVLKQLNTATHRAINPNELWVALDGDAADGVLQTLPGVSGVLVRDEVRQALKSHPMALGLRSVTTFGYALTSLLSLVGFGTYFTLSAQQRATMYGVLRTLGLSPGQLYGSLILEQVILIVWGLGLGAALGSLLNRLILPGLPISLGDTPPVPPFIPQDDWSAVGRLALALALAFVGVLGIATGLLLRARLHRVLRIGQE